MKITKRKIQCIAVIFGVIVLPLLYSYLYLGAFWDPYSRLETLPVAVVNNDNGATINGEERNLGEDICQNLKEDGSLKFIFTTEAEAKSGTKGDDYYAMIVIPSDFSENIASASTQDKHTAKIIYSPNEKRNYLASQILSRAVVQIEEKTRSSIDAEISQQLVDKLKEVPVKMGDLQDGVNQLADGTNKLYDGSVTLHDGTTELSAGAKKLADGTATYNTKFKDYQAGVTKVKDGTVTLGAGMTSLDSGIGQLLAGANQVTASTANIDALTTGAKTLSDGANTFNDGLAQYTAGVDSLIATSSATSSALGSIVAADPSLMAHPGFAAFMSSMSASSSANAQKLQQLQAAGAQLRDASAKIKDGSGQLSNGASNLPQLKAALIQMAAGLQTAKDGSTQLIAGTQTLYGGISQVSDATTQLAAASSTIATGAKDLSTGANKLDTGAATLSDGLSDLKDGTQELQSGIDTSISDANKELVKLDGLSDYVEAPVTFEQNNITTVPNYGTAFAPYFMSLSLWVGGLIIFVAIYYDPDRKFKILSSATDNKVARSFIYLVIGLVQAIILATILKYGLGLEVANEPLYYLSCCLVSVVFISMIQFFMIFLKDAGKFISMVLLILQLTSCGGTFPLETIPKFFGYLYPFMPMTYSVGLFKQTISGVNHKELMYNGEVLFIILLVFMSLTMVFSLVKSKKEDRRIEAMDKDVTDLYVEA